MAPTLAGAPGRGVVDVASMAIGRSRFEVLALAFYVPVVVALLVARAWRLTWAARAAGLVVVFLGLAILQDRDALPFRVPEIGVLLAPVGLGLAHRRGGLRRRRSVTTSPGARSGGASRSGCSASRRRASAPCRRCSSVTDGAWYAPRSSLIEAVEAPLPAGHRGASPTTERGRRRLPHRCTSAIPG